MYARSLSKVISKWVKQTVYLNLIPLGLIVLEKLAQTALGQQVFDVCRVHCEAMVSPNSVCDDFAREPEALQAQDTGWDFHDVEIT